jgi:hypothetical protein
LAIQAKANALKKEIRDINARYNAEKDEMEKLAVPLIVDNTITGIVKQ